MESERYPKSTAALRALLHALGVDGDDDGFTVGAVQQLGPAVLRARPVLSRPRSTAPAMPPTSPSAGTTPDVDTMLGELVDMVLVGADEGQSGRPEVHLQFKSDVFGGLHLRLIRQAQGLEARFMVDDSATRRAVEPHVDDLLGRLRDKGFAVVGAQIEVGRRG